MENDIATNPTPEMAKASKEKKILSELRKFPAQTQEEMECFHCDYVGKMGVVSEKLKPWVRDVMIFSFLIAFTLIAFHFYANTGSSRVILALGLLGWLPALYFNKKNRLFVYGCPSCQEHQSDGNHSDPPPWFAWWKTGTAIALLIIAGSLFFVHHRNKVREEQSALESAKIEAAKITADAEIEQAQQIAPQRSPQQIDRPEASSSRAASSSSDTQSSPDSMPSESQQQQDASSLNSPSSGVASIDDVAAVPNLTERGRAIYRDFLAHPSPRAFLLCRGGGFTTMYVVGNHQDKLDAMVANRASGCEPYAINDDVVWRSR